MKPATRPTPDSLDLPRPAPRRSRFLRQLAGGASLVVVTAGASTAHALTIVPTNDANVLAQALVGQGVNIVNISLTPAGDFTGISSAIMSVAIRCTVSRCGTPSATSEA